MKLFKYFDIILNKFIGISNYEEKNPKYINYYKDDKIIMEGRYYD